MSGGKHHQEQAMLATKRAHQLLAQPARLDAYDWALVAVLIVEADDEVRRAQGQDAAFQLPLLRTVLDELCEATSNFTNQNFLRASKAARRQKPNLFRTNP